MKIYELAKPFNTIMDCIENDKKNEANNKLALVQKLRHREVGPVLCVESFAQLK